MSSALTRMFNPSSVAVIGASSNPTRVGGRPVHYLKQYYSGAIYPVNPGRDVVQGLKSYPSILDIEGPVDLALIVLPAPDVLDALRQCIAKGVDACVILSSGFAEEGEAGAAMQREIQAVAREAGIRVMGPNCMGVANNKLGSWSTFAGGLLQRPRVAGLSVVTQSGGFASYLLLLLNQRQMGLTHWITLGNQADVDFSESLDFLADDPDTRVILGYLEGIEDGDRLVRALQKARRNGKFVVMLKVGRSEAGAIATASHTATLAGSDAIYDSVLRQYGAYRAETVQEALNVAYACLCSPALPAGNRVGLITVSGGLGVLMADAATKAGLEVTAFSGPLQEKLKAFLPFSNVRNPVDITAQIVNDFSLFNRTLDALVEFQECDLIVIYQMGVDYTHMREAIVKALAEFRARQPDTIVALILHPNEEIRRGYEELGYLVFEEPSAPFAPLSALWSFAQSFGKGGVQADAQSVSPGTDVASASFAEGAGDSVGGVTLPAGSGTLNERESKQVLAAAGLQVLEEYVAISADDAVQAAERIGYPVVLKVVSADLLHKSDVGGVALNLSNADEVRASFEGIMASVKRAAPTARVDGVLVAPMIRDGLEFSLGVQDDPVFGPVVMAGMGGVFIEVLKDVSFRRAPVSRTDVHSMLDELRGRALLDGVRGAPEADIEAVIDAIVSLSNFASKHCDRVASVDVNPILVRPSGKGAVVVDAVVQLK